jgi:hypothetical protein
MNNNENYNFDSKRVEEAIDQEYENDFKNVRKK